MVQRYTNWDKQRYKTSRNIPWWSKNIHIVQRIAWGAIFIWAFGGIYKMLLLPDDRFAIRALDPRHSEDATRFLEIISKRNKSLFDRGTSNEGEEDGQK